MATPSAAYRLLRQGGLYIAYSPSLDISTTGKSETEARDRFQSVLDICKRANVPKSGVAHKLTELGWTQKSKRWAPPDLRPKVPVKAATKVAKKKS